MLPPYLAKLENCNCCQPPNSPGLNPQIYNILKIMQQQSEDGP